MTDLLAVGIPLSSASFDEFIMFLYLSSHPIENLPKGYRKKCSYFVSVQSQLGNSVRWDSKMVPPKSQHLCDLLVNHAHFHMCHLILIFLLNFQTSNSKALV